MAVEPKRRALLLFVATGFYLPSCATQGFATGEISQLYVFEISSPIDLVTRFTIACDGFARRSQRPVCYAFRPWGVCS